ncbi:MAG TPA: metalloregulator ArsR/SmtB family transcription factor [Ornithinibacter sp.]|nr:metalloregulator ArsR/SmtB family transcription factor [Ornithinibacter sp.]
MDVFAAIADPVRRDLLRTLSAGSARVVDLAADRPISRPAVSKHLRVLAEAGLVVAQDVGRERHYRVRAEALHPVEDLLAEIAAAGARPPVTPTMLDALDLEVRRVGRERLSGDHATERAADHSPPRETA